MRILQMTVENPFPAVSGGDIRNSAIALACKSLGSFLNLSIVGDPMHGKAAGVDCYVLSSSQEVNPWRMAKTYHPTVMDLSPLQCDEIEAKVNEYKPDIVILEGVAFAQIMPLLKKQGIPVILDMHNIESALLKESISQFSFIKRLLRRHRYHKQIKAAAQDDIDAARLATSVWVCSNIDRATLLDLTLDVQAKPIPNPVPDENLFNIPIEEDRYRSANMAYIGHLFFFPNVDAISQFIRYGIPLLRDQNCKLVVAGRSPNKKIRQLCNGPHIELIENPPDVSQIIARSAYAPIPMRFGSGTRIKVLEAMAAGVVVCASAKAVEGLDIVAGEHFIRADSAVLAAQEIRHFTENPAQAVRMAQKARQFVRDNHTFKTIRRAVGKELKAASQPTSD